VKGPVQSYSLFDTIWSRQNTPPRECKSLLNIHFFTTLFYVRETDVVFNGSTQWAKSLKSSLKECVFINSALKIVPYCQKYDYGDFAHWEKP